MIKKPSSDQNLLEIFLISMKDSILETLMVSFFFMLPQRDALYEGVLSYFQLSDKLVFVVFTTLTHCVLYFASYAFFEICERFGYFEKYKIKQLSNKQEKPSNKLIFKTLKEAMIGQLIMQPIFLYIM